MRGDTGGPGGRGVLGRAVDWLFGAQVRRLRVAASRTHWLSYLLIISQSIAVILVFGHAEVGLLLTRNLAEMIGAALALFVLTITVMAADIALLDTLTRVAPLARNRQSVMLAEHILYILFVMAVEGSTYGIVLYTLDSNPQALVRPAPLIPTVGLAFLALVLMRVVLICWSAVQLIVVRGKLPVLLSTLMNVGTEIVGAHVERQLTELDLANIPVRDTFSVYAQMAQAPRPTRGLFNGWAVKRALAREAEENRQAANIAASLDALNSHRVAAASALTTATIERPLPPTGGPNGNGPGSGGSPSRLNNATRRAAIERDMLTARAYDLDADDADGGWSARNDAEEFDMEWEERQAHPTHPRKRKSNSSAARMARREAAITVDPDAPVLLPTPIQPTDSREGRRILRYLDRHPHMSNLGIADALKINIKTVRGWHRDWIARQNQRGIAAAPMTEEMAAITPEMLSDDTESELRAIYADEFATETAQAR